MIAGDDPNLLAINIENRLNFASFVESIEVALCATGRRSLSRGDPPDGNLDEVDDVRWMTHSDNSPLSPSLVRIPSPENLCRAFGLRLEDKAGRKSGIGILVPRFNDVDLGCDNTGENDPTNFIFSDWLNSNADAPCVRSGTGLSDLDRCIANESGKFNRPRQWIGERLVEPNDSADWDRLGSRVVNAHRGRVLHMCSRAASTGHTILVQRIGGG